ncbi:MAG TPA: NAD-dependent epimerase/dehydratase family protein [Polyangiaceae bacterium]|jgi:uncharacterized protein YbjT (DUF2867 family)
MRVLLFGASGMIGQGVLRECLLAPDVTEVVSVVRAATPAATKLREIVAADMYDLTPIKDQLRGIDACFFCLGVSSAGMNEADYRHVTYDLTLHAARVLHEVSPGATFIYVSGRSTDSTEKGSSMWARVKGKTENDLLGLFSNAVMFRPGVIRPLHGIKPKSKAYRVAYALLWPAVPVLQMMFPNDIATTEGIGRAMLEVARHGAPQKILESQALIELGRKGAAAS